MEAEIMESICVLDSEDLVSKAYEGILGLMDIFPKDKQEIDGIAMGCSKKTLDFFMPIVTGLYFPATKRCFWAGRFDVDVDDLPKEGAVYTDEHGDRFTWVSFKRIKTLPSFVRGAVKGCIAYYQVAKSQSGKPQYCNATKNALESFVSFFGIKTNGEIVPFSSLSMFQAHGYRDNQTRERAMYWGSGAINLVADSKYLWKIEATEKFGWGSLGRELSAKMIFGTAPDMVKSLFYARDLPITAAGRRRPILHWVSAHKRRLEKGTDVDIAKYLRGITQFVMGDLPFSITSPIKAGCV